MNEEKVKKFMTRRQKEFIFYCCLLAVPVLHFIIFYIAVNFNSFLLAFKNYNADDGSFSWVGFDNFSRLFSDMAERTVYGKAFRNSLAMYLVGTFTGTCLTLAFSYYIYKKAPMKKFFKIMLFAPSIIPSIAMVTMYKQFVENAIPAFAKTIFGVAMSGLLQNPDTTFGSIIFYNIWVGFGVGILLYLGAMQSIPDSILEAAQLDGVNSFQEFIRIVFPLIYGTFSTFMITALGGIFINQANLFSFFGYNFEENYVTVGFYLYRETVMNSSSYSSFPFLSAMGLLLTAITLPLVFGLNRLLRRIGPSME